MKKVLAYSLLLLGFCLSAYGNGQDDTKLTKTVTKSFAVPDNGSVRIVNKYGPVTINTWTKDSVKVEIITTAWGKNDKSVEKMMRRVDFDFIQSSRYLEISTVLDRSSGFFAEVWNNIGDYSKTLLSQNKLKIEYKIYIPEHLDLEINNKFGDIYLYEYAGKLDVTLSHGNIRATKLTQVNLDLSFGNADIKSVREASLSLKGTECTFTAIGNATITSSSSDIQIAEATFLKLDSRSDRKVRIEHVDEIQGSSNFSKFDIGQINDIVRLDLNYGEIKIGPQEAFNAITLTGKNTPITVQFEPTALFAYEIEGQEDKIQLPAGHNAKKSYLNEKDNLARFTGTVGKTPSGKLKVFSDNGEVEIELLK
jgi:hypothetical protein